MQEIFITIILSLVQGVLEFLPISSSAHLSIASSVLKLGDYKNLKFFLESATFLVVLFYFRSLLIGSLVGIFSKSSRKESCLLFLKLGLSCIPFAIAFFFLHNLLENISLFLILGSVLMVLTEIKFKMQGAKTFSISDVSFKQSFFIGCFQVLSIFSGFSRSGSSICGGLICGLSRANAVRFSFLISLPLTFASLCYDFYKIKPIFNASGILGFFICLTVASIAIKPCFKIVSSVNLSFFAFYRILLAMLIIFFL
jgi:undecaprenyl-diphosphatase